MRSFQNLSTRTKLLLGFVTVSILLGGVASFAVYKMGTINDSLTTLTKRDVVGLHDAYEANVKLQQIRRCTRDALLATAHDVMQAKKTELATLTAAFDAARKAVEPTLVTPEEMAAYAVLKEDSSRYFAGCLETIEFALRDKHKEGVENVHSTHVLSSKMEDAMKALCELKTAIADRTAKASTATYNNASLTVIIAIVMGVAVSLALGWLIARFFANALGKAIQVLETLAKGDFTTKLEVDTKDEVGRMARALNAAIDSIQAALQETRTVADTVAAAAQQLSASAEEIASGAQEQASSLEETASSLEEITGTIQQNADNAQQANQLAGSSHDAAEKGGQVVARAVQGMSEINASSRKIADIITVIDEIAFQTNLLALNAAVEAARAGEQGRGFAVVAGEVRNLAQRSAGAAKEIKGLIQDSVGKVEAGTKLVNQSGETLNEIVTSVKRVTDIVAEIAAASREQATGIEQVNKAVTQMDSVTQGNASQTEELSGTAEGLTGQAQQLQALVARFKLAETVQKPTVAVAPTAIRPSAAAPKVAATKASKPARAKPQARPAPELELVGAYSGSNGHGGFEEF
jgi:methyl-accepting chemotaxis protein